MGLSRLGFNLFTDLQLHSVNFHTKGASDRLPATHRYTCTCMERGGERKTKAEMGPDGDDPLPIGNKDAEKEPQPAAEESADKPKPSAAVDGGGEKESPLDPNFRMWSDNDLSDIIAMMKGGFKRMGTNLPDGGKKLRASIMRFEAELQNRKIRRDDEKCRELVQSINNGTCAGELKLRPTDTINTQSLKRMKIIKSQGQWVAQTKGFNPTSRSSTLPFEDEKEEEEAEDIAQVPGAPTDIPGSSAPRSSSSRFTFTEDHYNLLNVRINSLTSTVDGLGGILHQIQVQQDQIQAQQDAILAQQAAMQARQNDFYAHFYTHFPLSPPPGP